jgi:hypothetical protein
LDVVKILQGDIIGGAGGEGARAGTCVRINAAVKAVAVGGAALAVAPAPASAVAVAASASASASTQTNTPSAIGVHISFDLVDGLVCPHQKYESMAAFENQRLQPIA